MADAPKGAGLGQRLRSLRDWLLGISDETLADPRSQAPESGDPDRIGRYAILRRLGQGGMGVVYAARDEQLGRTLAIKTLTVVGADETARKRFLREAQAAASVNHPHVCQVYEIGEEPGRPFIVMELLEGESLAERLKRGPLPVDEALRFALEVLSALAALHSRGFVHRDLKPSNVFLTPHGVKVLDFGLARQAGALAPDTPATGELTGSGIVVGTPRYMAPEQALGKPIGAGTDVFALGAILYEALAGRPAFGGQTVGEVLHATLHEQPAALTGPPAVVAADRVVRRALAKDAERRYPTAEAMAAELRAILGAEGTSGARARPLTRLVVLPFRLLRPDPDVDFLSFGLADAVSTSLSGLQSLVIRSTAAAARLAGDPPDFKAIAVEADVDLVVVGSTLRSGERLRVTTQLVEVPAGTLAWSHTAESAVGEVFALQDELSRRIVEALALPLAGREPGRPRDVPASARAYELYLRANEVARDLFGTRVARDLYLQCVAEDPDFAPAWARLARCHRVIGKYLEDPAGNAARAEDAFRHAFALNPDLPIAHRLYTHFESETGHASQAITRLLGRVQAERNDPELFAGLVHACRYAGLFEASLAAHEEARRLDPHIPTSALFTLLMACEFERAAAFQGADSDVEPVVFSLAALGRWQDAAARLRAERSGLLPDQFRRFIEALEAAVGGRSAEAVEFFKAFGDEAPHYDPEALFMSATLLAELGERVLALDTLKRVVDRGFAVAPTLERHPWLASLRGDPRFEPILAEARRRRDQAREAFRQGGGEALLGVSA
jgi:serine/threonine protein kinase/tetratricopeptide (TPR) repeat protein